MGRFRSCTQLFPLATQPTGSALVELLPVGTVQAGAMIWPADVTANR
jgi:hypothetical protein